MNCYIFGAHSRAQTVAEYIRVLHPKTRILGYIVDNDEENQEQIKDIPVIQLKNGCWPDGYALEDKATVYLGIRGQYHAEVTDRLWRVGFRDIIPVTPKLDIELRNRYMKKAFALQGRDFCKMDEVLFEVDGAFSFEGIKTAVYVAKSAVDRPLSQDVALKEYEYLIQAGHALAECDIDGCAIYDDAGENISERNRQFSELTGLYWLWKHADDDVIGLEHYRRRFLLPNGWQRLFAQGKADVILPVPLYVAPSLKENYLFRHDHRPWEAMMRRMKEIPDLYDAAEEFFSTTGCYSPCNMMIVRKSVLDDLCSWMFPIILGAADEVGVLEDTYQNRYGGFLSERMITFFFWYYRDKYKVLYADKSFLG